MLLVNAVTNVLPDSFQYNATLLTNPLARFINRPTSTLADVAPACKTVIGSASANTLVSSCPNRGLVSAILNSVLLYIYRQTKRAPKTPFCVLNLKFIRGQQPLQ